MSETEKLKYLILKAIKGEPYTLDDIKMAREMDSAFHFPVLIANLSSPADISGEVVNDFLDDVLEGS